MGSWRFLCVVVVVVVWFFYLSDIIFFLKQPALIENFTVLKLVFTETFLWLVFSLYYFKIMCLPEQSTGISRFGSKHTPSQGPVVQGTLGAVGGGSLGLLGEGGRAHPTGHLWRQLWDLAPHHCASPVLCQ